MAIDATVWVAIVSGVSSLLLAAGNAVYKLRAAQASAERAEEDASAARLEAHPLFALSLDSQLRTRCVDAARAELFNEIGARVLLEPVCRSMRALCGCSGTSPRGARHFAEKVLALRSAIAQSQLDALAAFPKEVREVVLPVLRLHQETLEPLFDAVRTGRPHREAMDLVFNVVHVATYSALRRWAHASAQINGHLNGLTWRGRVLQYVHRGDLDDATRDLALAVRPLEGLSPCFAYLASEDLSTVVTEGWRGFTGRLALPPRGRALDLRAEGPGGDGSRVSVWVGDGSPSAVGARHFSAPVLVLQPGVQRCTVGLCCEAAVSAADAHTRFAFLTLMLTSCERHSVTLSRVAQAGLKVDRFWQGGFEAPSFLENVSLHEQLEVDPSELGRIVERCSRRILADVLHAGSFPYERAGAHFFAEAFLVEDCACLLLAHRREVPEELPFSARASTA